MFSRDKINLISSSTDTLAIEYYILYHNKVYYTIKSITFVIYNKTIIIVASN